MAKGSFLLVGGLLLATFLGANTTVARQGFDRFVLPLIRIAGLEDYGFDRGDAPEFGRGQRVQTADWSLKVTEMRELGSLPNLSFGGKELQIGGKWVVVAIEGKRSNPDDGAKFPVVNLRDENGRAYPARSIAKSQQALENPETVAGPAETPAEGPDRNKRTVRRFLAFEVDRSAEKLQLFVP